MLNGWKQVSICTLIELLDFVHKQNAVLHPLCTHSFETLMIFASVWAVHNHVLIQHRKALTLTTL
jgi:hypothetical protein